VVIGRLKAHLLIQMVLLLQFKTQTQCEGTIYIRLRFAGLPMSISRDLMHCEDVGSVAWFVKECVKKGRQQLSWVNRGLYCYAQCNRWAVGG
jgi:hypothetical protein